MIGKTIHALSLALALFAQASFADTTPKSPYYILQENEDGTQDIGIPVVVESISADGQYQFHPAFTTDQSNEKMIDVESNQITSATKAIVMLGTDASLGLGLGANLGLFIVTGVVNHKEWMDEYYGISARGGIGTNGTSASLGFGVIDFIGYTLSAEYQHERKTGADKVGASLRVSALWVLEAMIGGVYNLKTQRPELNLGIGIYAPAQFWLNILGI